MHYIYYARLSFNASPLVVVKGIATALIPKGYAVAVGFLLPFAHLVRVRAVSNL
jgi:hypothetical protein